MKIIPKLIKAGSKTVLLGSDREPPKVDIRIFSEDNVQDLAKDLKKLFDNNRIRYDDTTRYLRKFMDGIILENAEPIKIINGCIDGNRVTFSTQAIRDELEAYMAANSTLILPDKYTVWVINSVDGGNVAKITLKDI